MHAQAVPADGGHEKGGSTPDPPVLLLHRKHVVDVTVSHDGVSSHLTAAFRELREGQGIVVGESTDGRRDVVGCAHGAKVARCPSMTP